MRDGQSELKIMSVGEFKLYSAYSVVNAFHDRDNVNFVWFVKRRPHPVATYKDYLAGYGKKLPEATRLAMQRQLDALFLESEIDQLKQYLAEHHDTELFFRKATLPLEKRKFQHLPTGGKPEVAGTGIYRLSDEPDFKLPIQIWGFYDLRTCPLSTLAQMEQIARKPGVRFLRAALTEMGLAEVPTEEQLDTLVKRLYDCGFSVSQGQMAKASHTKQTPSSPPAQRPLPQ